MSAASRNVLRGIRQDPAAVALAKEVETLEAQETMRLDAIRDAADVRVMRQKLAEAERRLAGVRTLLTLGGHTAAYDLRADLLAILDATDERKGEP